MNFLFGRQVCTTIKNMMAEEEKDVYNERASAVHGKIILIYYCF